jgi:hypothetical protein
MRGRNQFRDAPVLTENLKLADLATKYEGLFLRVCCRAPQCIHCSDLNIVTLLKQSTPPRLLADLKRRARCTECSCRGQVVLFPTFVGRER